MKRAVGRYFLIAGAIGMAVFAAWLAHTIWSLPSIVVITTGPPGGTFEGYGRRYKEIFARAGVTLQIVQSGGSLENLKLLNDPRSGVSVGFVQSGLTNKQLSPGLVSLGTVSYECLWCFYRGADPGERLEGLRGRKISIGPEGSGTRDLSLKLLAIRGVDPATAEMLPLSPTEAGDRLLKGEINAAFILASWDTPVVRRLLADSHVEVMNFIRADAYVALDPSLTKLVLPAGVGNMADNRPTVDTNLLATRTSLVVRNDVPPAIQYLLLQTANEVHSGPQIFQRSGQFPAPEQMDIPLSKLAQQYYKSGLPFLQRYLPFPLAAFTGRVLVILLPLVGVLYPLLKLAPLYGWSMKQRIFRLYGEVKLIEIELETKPEESLDELRKRLDQLESRAIHLRVPVTYAHYNYQLRDHIRLVRSRLEKTRSERNSH